MFKHPEITEQRIVQLVDRLERSARRARAELQLELCSEAHPDLRRAKRGRYAPVRAGASWGPAFCTVWFRARGRVPKSWGGGHVVARVDTGSECTLWNADGPARGIDGEHPLVTVARPCRGGERVDLWLEAYGSLPPGVVVHGRTTPPPKKPYRIGGAELLLQDDEQLELWHDCRFALELARSLPAGDAARAHLLRALDRAADLLAAGGQRQRAEARAGIRAAWKPGRDDAYHTVHPFGHAHLDTAWLWPLEVTEKKMAHTAATQLALLEQYPDYTFVHSQPAQYAWLQEHYPKLFSRVRGAVAAGRWQPAGGLWVEPDCNVPSGESMVRQLVYGMRYFREELGVEVREAWLPDIFGFSGSLPQIFVQAGLDCFITQKLSWSQFNELPHHTFWWQGIDGTRIWAHFPPADTYGGDCTPTQLRAHLDRYRDHARCDHGLYPFGFGDGGGGPTAEQLELLQRARGATTLPRIARGSLREFVEQAQADSDDLQTWSGELYLEFHRGTYTTQARCKADNRRCELALRDAELLAAHALAPARYPAAQLEQLWKLVLLNQFHDILPGSGIREVYARAASDHREVLSGAEQIAADALVSLARAQPPAPGARGSSGGGPELALFQFSTLGAEGRIPARLARPLRRPRALICGEREIPLQRVELFGEDLLLFAVPDEALTSVARCTISSEQPAASAAPAAALEVSARRLRSDALDVRLDRHGNLSSVKLRQSGAELIARGERANMLQLFDDQPLDWSAWDIDIFALQTGRDLSRSERVEVVEQGPVRIAVEVEKRFGKSRVVQRISLGPTPGIRFDTLVDWYETDKLLKVAFPLAVHAERARFEVQFGHVERATHRNTSWEVAKFEMPAQRWADLSEGGQGAALVNDSKYGYDVRDNVLRMTLLRSPRAPDPQADVGRHVFSYALLPHRGDYRAARVVEAATALNSRLFAVALDSGRRSRKKAAVATPGGPLVACSSPDVMVDTVKRADEGGDQFVVRLYEAHRTRGQAHLRLSRPVQRAWLCDLHEDAIEPLRVDKTGVRFRYRPFELLTIKAEC